MKHRENDPAVHELRDRPVPPVKGAIIDRQDVRPHPERTNARSVPAMDEIMDMGNWM